MTAIESKFKPLTEVLNLLLGEWRKQMLDGNIGRRRNDSLSDSLQFLTHVAGSGAYPLEDERLGKGCQMSQTAYVLHHTEDQRELDRLRAIEVVFDPASQRRIRSTGFTHGWRCLEVGAGAGSVASWMASVSGLSGHTTAIDSNTRFLTGLSSGVRVVAGDRRTAALEPESFDLVHARSVLTHRPDVAVALESMLVALRQGGWLVLEEPDFTAARAIAGDKQEMQSVAHVNGAILRLFSAPVLT